MPQRRPDYEIPVGGVKRMAALLGFTRAAEWANWCDTRRPHAIWEFRRAEAHWRHNHEKAFRANKQNYFALEQHLQSEGRLRGSLRDFLDNASEPLLRDVLEPPDSSLTTALPPITDCASSFRRYRILVRTGRVAEADAVLTELLHTCTRRENRLFLLGTQCGLRFIQLNNHRIVEFADWQTEAPLSHLATELGVPSLTALLMSPRLLYEHPLRDHAYYPLTLAAMCEAERHQADNRLCLTYLEWHERLLRHYINIRPEVAWNRFTPLVAQKLRLGFIDSARRSWKFQHRYGSYGFRASSPFHKEMAMYALAQREHNSIEWRLHMLLDIQLCLSEGDADRARSLARHAMESLPLFVEQFYTAGLSSVHDYAISKSARRSEGWPVIDIPTHAGYFGRVHRDHWANR